MLLTLTSVLHKELGMNRTNYYTSGSMEMNVSAAVSLDPLLEINYVKLVSKGFLHEDQTSA